MLAPGPAKKLTIYINEDARYHHGSLYDAVLEFLRHHAVAGATASRAIAGFGSGGVLHTQRTELLAEHLPIRIECVDRPEKIESLLPALQRMIGDGLIEMQDTTILRSGGEPASGSGPHTIRHTAARLMRIFLGEADQANGGPLYDAIVRRLRAMEVAGATVYRGILGYGAKGHTHRKSFFHLSRDLPVVISVIDTPEKIEAAAAAVAGMLEDGLIVISEVEMTRIVRSAPDEDTDAGESR
jgi:PII-like signaling protein